MTTAKICGLTTTEAVQAALDGSASHLGFMFFDKSPRRIGIEEASRLAQSARWKADIVAVVVDPDDATLDRIADGLKPHLFQLHGSETPARAADIVKRTGRGVIKVLPVREMADLDLAAQYEDIAEHLMFDAKPPQGADRPGGLGTAFDWTILSGRRFKRPYFLAGGLDPWNVSEAVRQSGAPIVDVSSGVERGPGVKDPRLISAFLDAVRRV
ncbi:MAG TPA: phosphoribosylanthranilate isomerase [Caulobacteraceae bacterium]|nr:phosphoribosylanthranilate isomerase [Caulobacteraceae bacterium]